MRLLHLFRRPLLPALAAVLAFAVAAHAAKPEPAPPVAPLVLHFESYMGKGLLLKATIHGVPGDFLFDTGGGLTNVGPAFASRIGCKPWGQITGFTMEAHRIDMQHCDNFEVSAGGAMFPLPVLGVADLSGMMPPDAPHLDGTIGLDAFAGKALTFSYSKRTLTVETPASLAARTAHLQPVPMRLVRDGEGAALSADLAVQTSAGLAWMEIDSGNVSPICLMGKHLASLYNADPNKREPQELKVQLAGGAPVEASFLVRDLIMDGNLGTSFLAHWDITFDLANSKAWIAPAA